MTVSGLMVLGMLMVSPELPGGPDGFGYRWIRSVDAGGPSFTWIDATSGQRILLGDDQARWVSVPFSFWFYNEDFADSIAVSSNGWVSFTTATPNAPPLSWPDNIFGAALSVFGTDLGPDTLYVLTVGTKLVIEWFNAELVAGNGRYTFEAIIDAADSSITFQYLSHEGADWTAYGYSFVGIQNRDISYSLSVSSALLRDSLAIKFYYEPEHDLSVSILYPGDGFLLLDQGADSVLFSLRNNGITEAIHRAVVCSVSTGGTTVFVDTFDVPQLAVNSSFVGKFSGWQREPGRRYRVNVSVQEDHDPYPANNRDSVSQVVGFSASDTIALFDGGVSGGVWYSSQFQAFGVEIHPDTLPFLLRYVGVWLLSPGDPGWPGPDTTADPAIVEVWTGDTMPRTRVLADTLLRDDIWPGWVYLVLPDSNILWGDRFWIAVRTRVNSSYGIEALAYDSTLNYPDAQWIQERDGRWRRGVFADGDPLIFVSGEPLNLQFRGDIVLNYIYPAWSHLIFAGADDSVIVEVGNLGPYSVSGISIYCSLSDSEGVVLADTVFIPSLAAGRVDTISFGTYTIRSDMDSLVLSCNAFSAQDSVQDNNHIFAVLRAVSEANDTVVFGDEPSYNYFVPSDTSQLIAVEVMSDTPRSFLKYVSFWLVTPGDPCWPPEDTTIDPVLLQLWKGDSLPENLLFQDTLWRDNVQPGWVYWVPPESISLDDNIWIALKLALTSGRSEALALDSTYDNPNSVFLYADGTWQRAPQLHGDPILWVFRDVNGNSISESGGNRNGFEEGFVGFRGGVFNDRLAIRFSLKSNSHVVLRIYDVSGREVKFLYDGRLTAGEHRLYWDLRDKSGRRVADGIYFVSLDVGDRHYTKKFVILKP